MGNKGDVSDFELCLRQTGWSWCKSNSKVNLSIIPFMTTSQSTAHLKLVS